MADTDVRIRISAVGGEDAAAALSKSQAGLDSITSSSSKLQDQFSHKFSHVGLQLFAGDALRASGLGAETRIIIGTLNTAIMAMGASFGAAAAPIMLTVTAFIAVAGIIDKVVNSHKDLGEQLAKTIQANEALSKNYTDSVDAVNQYNQEIGGSNKFLDDYAQSQSRAKRAIDDTNASMHLQVIEGLNEMLVKQKEALDSNEALTSQIQNHDQSLKKIIPDMKSWDAALGGLATTHTTLATQISTTEAKIKTEEGSVVALHHGYSNLNDMLKDNVTAHKAEVVAAKEAEDQSAKQVEANQTMAESINALKDKETEYELDVRDQGELTMAKKNQQTDNWLNKQIDAINKLYAADVKYANDHIQDTQELNQHLILLDTARNHTIEAAEADHDSKLITAETRRNQQMTEMGQKTGDSIAGAFGTATAKMIVEGKSFSESITAAFKNLTEQIIADIIRIEIEELALYALEQMTGVGGAAMAGGGMFQAEGGSYLVDKPTMFIAGEAGQPELATFTPMSKMGSGQGSFGGGGGGNISIGNIQTSIYGVDDPDQIADAVGRKIIERIRGMGEQNFTRSS